MGKTGHVEAQTFRHANVVRALAAGFGADSPETVEILKSKLKHLYGEGFAPPAQGRGREIEYTFGDIMDWAVALTLISLGLPPKIMLRKLRRGYYMEHVEPLFAKASPQPAQIYIIHFCNMLVEGIPGDPTLWGLVEGESDLRRKTARSMMIGLDYAVSNFTKTRSAVHAVLRHIIEAGIRS